MSLVQIQHVSLEANHLPHPILEQLSYEIATGDFVILLGGNGSGKSSLLKLLYREYTPSKGKIYFHHQALAELPLKQFCEEVAVLTQNFGDSLFSSLTIYENYLLANGSKPDDKLFLKSYLKKFNPNLANKIDRLPTQLSGGEKQALALALCLLKHPSLLLLDEHTSALDPKTSHHIMQLTQQMINEHHITCMLATHDLDIALNYGNRILMLHEGKIHRLFDQEEKLKLTKDDLVRSYF